SSVVAVAVRVKFASLVGVTRRLDKVHPPTLNVGLPHVSTKLTSLPSLTVAPTGMALTTSDCSELVSPARPFTVAASVPSVIAARALPLAVCVSCVIVVSSVPGVLAAQLTVGANGFTVTASVFFLHDALPISSSVVAVAVRVKFASLVGVTRRLDKVHPPTF